jgi:Uma2 family endonuclease
MATATLKKRALVIGPECNGIRLSAREFDQAEFEEGWVYELINGVLIVTPPPLENERDPNDELGYWLRNYRDRLGPDCPLEATLPEHEIAWGENRRRADRAIWIGLGRLPRQGELPSIAVEFVSFGRRNWLRDYEAKRDEYLDLGIREYWVFNRFDHTLTVYTRTRGKIRTRVFRESQTYRTNLLPGFELPLAKLFAMANRWPVEDG